MILGRTTIIVLMMLLSSIAARADWEYWEGFGPGPWYGWVKSGGYELLVGCDWGPAVYYVTPTPISKSAAEALGPRGFRLFIGIDEEEFTIPASALHREGEGLEFKGDLTYELMDSLMDSLIAAKRTINVSVLLSDPTERGWSQAFSVRGSTRVLRRVRSVCDDDW